MASATLSTNPRQLTQDLQGVLDEIKVYQADLKQLQKDLAGFCISTNDANKVISDPTFSDLSTADKKRATDKYSEELDKVTTAEGKIDQIERDLSTAMLLKVQKFKVHLSLNTGPSGGSSTPTGTVQGSQIATIDHFGGDTKKAESWIRMMDVRSKWIQK